MKVRKTTILLALITLYGVNSFAFERLLFFNELLSLIGFYYFIQFSFTKDFHFRYPNNALYKYILLLVFLLVLYAFISLGLKTNWYYYFRNLSIIYPIFTFFLGYYLYPYQFAFFKKFRNLIYGYALISFSIGSPLLIDRNAYSFWFAHLQKNWKTLSLFFFIAIHFFYLFSYTSFTVVVILLGILVIRFYIRSYFQFNILFILCLVAFCIIFMLSIPYLKTYSAHGYNLFGDVKFVYSHHPLFHIDYNSSWRLVLWYRTIIETFPQCLFGIGIGTPIIPYLPHHTTSDLLFNDEYIAHVIGAHNTFITILIRFGILSLLFLTLIYQIVLKYFFKLKKYRLINNSELGVFLGFFALTIVGLFNLLLETPTLASLYWISLGFISRLIDFKNASYKVQNLYRAQLSSF